MMSPDYYEEAASLARMLDAQGRTVDAQGLRDAIINGSTGTEICMALRHAIAPLLSDSGLAAGTRALAGRIHRDLSQSLGG